MSLTSYLYICIYYSRYSSLPGSLNKVVYWYKPVRDEEDACSLIEIWVGRLLLDPPRTGTHFSISQCVVVIVP